MLGQILHDYGALMLSEALVTRLVQKYDFNEQSNTSGKFVSLQDEPVKVLA